MVKKILDVSFSAIAVAVGWFANLVVAAAFALARSSCWLAGASATLFAFLTARRPD